MFSLKLKELLASISFKHSFLLLLTKCKHQKTLLKEAFTNVSDKQAKILKLRNVIFREKELWPEEKEVELLKFKLIPAPKEPQMGGLLI